MVTLRGKGLVEPFPIDICREFGKCNMKIRAIVLFTFLRTTLRRAHRAVEFAVSLGEQGIFFDKLERKILVCFFLGLSNLEISCEY